MKFLSVAAALAGSASAGTILWDGRFSSTTAGQIAAWSWSNEAGPYQYYIHGSEAISSYVNLSPSYKNPADTGSTDGVKITLDSTSYWNGQTMRRTELIPQTSAAINAGHVFYHFSIMKGSGGTDEPSIYREHQICFFESHFTELKSGWISGESGTSDPLLRWDVGGTTQWSVNWADGVWHNVAYEIDFSGNTIAFWHSTGSDPLTLTVPAVSGSPSSNGEDWHLGVLELPVSGQSDTTEDFYFSGVYIESGSITTSVSGPGAAVVSSASAIAPTSTLVTSVVSSAASPSTSAASGSLPKYAQCGGTGWTGSGTCVAGTTCTASGSYYSQCL